MTKTDKKLVFVCVGLAVLAATLWTLRILYPGITVNIGGWIELLALTGILPIGILVLVVLWLISMLHRKKK